MGGGADLAALEGGEPVGVELGGSEREIPRGTLSRCRASGLLADVEHG